MKHSISMSEFKDLSETQQESLLAALVESARTTPPNGEIKLLDKEIEKFEKKFSISSEEMKKRLFRGKMRETSEICNWLMLLHTRGNFVAYSSRSR
jgi:hypothetical protein